MTESISQDDAIKIINELAKMDKRGTECESNNVVESGSFYDRFAVQLKPFDINERYIPNRFGSSINASTVKIGQREYIAAATPLGEPDTDKFRRMIVEEDVKVVVMLGHGSRNIRVR